MTMRLDIVTNDAGEGVRREHARELGAGVVMGLYRLAKLAQVHDLANQAFIRQLEQTHQIIGDYCLRSGSNVNVMFAHKAVFVAGQLLKGSRHTYESASELGELFERLGGSELSIQRDVTREELLAFSEQISNSYRGLGFYSPTPKIRLRPVADNARLRGLELEVLSEDQRIVRMYASAVVIMRRFYEDLQASRYILPRRVKRIAQSLVDLAAGSTPSFLGVTEVRNANFDEAGRAVNTAILAVSMAREVTQDRAVLSQIAMAGMMHDVARPRALALSQAAGPAMPGMQGPTALSEDQEDRLAAGAAAVLTALGRVNEPSITRTVLAFEALWIRRQAWLGPVYWGARAPTLHAKFIAVARRYNDLLTPEPGVVPPTPDFAVATLSEELKDPQDRTVLRMLVSALGLLPRGTMVQLATGEMAEVVRGPKGPGERPRVRIVSDANGQGIPPVELELGQDPLRQVARVVSVDGWRKGLEADAVLEEVPFSEAAGPLAPGLPLVTTPAPAPPFSLPPISPLSPVAMAPPGGTPHAQATSRSIKDLYADRASTEEDKPVQGSSPPRRESSSIQSSEHHSSASLPSMGSSPSAVAEAMGRMINDSLRPPLGGPRDVERTLFQDGSSPPSNRPGRTAREPTARGNLAATPLPHVLVYMLDHALTGSVVFEGTTGEDSIYFVGGVPTKIRLQDQVALLGQMLVHGGAIEVAAVDQAVEGARRLGVLLGEYLVGHDLVSREALSWALEAQLLNKIAYLANLAPEISYAYYRDVDLLEGWGGGDVSVGCALNPILASVRNWMDRARVRATLNRIGKHPLVLHDDAALTALALLPEEQAALDVIRGTALPLAQLFKQNVADEETVSSLVYTLAVTRQLAFKGQKKGPMADRLASQHPSAGPGGTIPVEASGPRPIGGSGVPSPHQARAVSSASPRSVAPAASQPPAIRRSGPMPPSVRPSGSGLPRASAPQIRPIAARKSTIVGIQPSGTAEQRQASAFPSASRPPGVSPPAPSAVGTPADGAKTIARPSPAAFGSRPPGPPGPVPQGAFGSRPPVTAPKAAGPGAAFGSRPPAFQSRPPAFQSRLAGSSSFNAVEIGDDGLADAEAALEAMQCFRSAEAALQRNDLGSAQRLAQKALDGDPTQNDYATLLAWTKALGGGGTAIAEAISTMTRVLHDDPSNERALLYRGKLYARGNYFREAEADFNELLAGNPHHRDAQAELRAIKNKLGG